MQTATALAEAAPDPTDPTSGSAAVERLRRLLPLSLRARVQSGRQLTRRDEGQEEREPLPTGLSPVDQLLAGGLPRGQLVELVGARSSGRFSAVLAALAATTGVGEAAALVDLGDGLDPQAAAAAGVDLERLLWIRPTSLKQALAATEMVIGGGFPLVVLDLGQPPLRGGRGVEAGWLRLARAARAQGSALLVGSPYRVSGTAAARVLGAAKARAAWQGGERGAPWLLAGIEARIALDKCRGRLPETGAPLALRTAEAPPPALALPARPKSERAREALPALRPLRHLQPLSPLRPLQPLQTLKAAAGR